MHTRDSPNHNHTCYGGMDMAVAIVPVGQKFAQLTVIQEAERRSGRDYWICECECGKRFEVQAKSVRRGNTKSCGCRRGLLRMKDVAGQRFGKLVVKRTFRKPSGGVWCECQCDCGKVSVAKRNNVTSGTTKSCGCRKNYGCRRTHGMAGSPEYNVWCAMLARCDNPNNIGYRDYGGRGIAVCERWRVFPNFLADMGRRPFPRATIERKDANGNYEPGNVVWATATEQQRNKRNNRRITVNGKTRCLAEWAEITGVNASAIWKRLNRGLSPEAAVAAEVR